MDEYYLSRYFPRTGTVASSDQFRATKIRENFVANYNWQSVSLSLLISDFYGSPVLSSGQTVATCQRNISQHCWAQHVVCVWPPCCDVLRHFGCCCLKFDHFQTWANSTQHIAIHRNMMAKRTQHVAPNNVAICCVGTLRSFGRCFTGSLTWTQPACLRSCTSTVTINSNFLLRSFKMGEYHMDIAQSANWAIFSHVTRLDRSPANENIWCILMKIWINQLMNQSINQSINQSRSWLFIKRYLTSGTENCETHVWLYFSYLS